MKPRVLFLSGDLGLGGAAIFVLNICDGLRTRGNWEPLAGVFYRLGEVGEQVRADGHHLLGPISDAWIQEEYIEGMFARCAAAKPSVVVANLGAETYDFLRYVPEGVLRVGIVHSDQECVYRVAEVHAEWLDLVVCVSEHSVKELAPRPKLAGVEIKSISCGVPIATRTRQATPGRLRVLYLGRVVEEQKRASLLSRIIRQSVERCEGIEWTIVGDGPDLPKLRSELADLSDAVEFTGPVDYRSVPGLVPDHDVYFLCSDYEGLPLSLLEAMSAGLVPVVSDLRSGISEVVHEGNGIKVNLSDEEGYVEALVVLAHDNSKLEALSVAAREKVIRDYSVEAMAERWERCMDRARMAGTVDWKLAQAVTVPKIAGNAWYYHPVFRGLRRFIKKARRGYFKL
jgi:glycosyltransferase involved in cell wall biosynthesis